MSGPGGTVTTGSARVTRKFALMAEAHQRRGEDADRIADGWEAKGFDASYWRGNAQRHYRAAAWCAAQDDPSHQPFTSEGAA